MNNRYDQAHASGPNRQATSPERVTEAPNAQLAKEASEGRAETVRGIERRNRQSGEMTYGEPVNGSPGTNADRTPLPRSITEPRTVETIRLKIHDRDSEGVIAIELIGNDGYSRSFFADADQALAEMAGALARDDYEDRTGGEL